MSDFDLPDLPSDEDLGITDEDRKFLEEMGGDGPEMSDKELAALLGEDPKAPKAAAGGAAAGAAGAAGAAPTKGGKPDRKAAKAAKAADRAAKKAAKAAAKKARAEEKRRAKEAKAAGKDPKANGQAETPPPAAEKPKESEPKKPRERRPEPVTPGARWRGAATLAALLALTVVASNRTGLPGTVEANAPDSLFSSSRAMSTLIEIAREPRPTGSPEHTRVREYLVDRLRSLGLEPEVQTAMGIVETAGSARTGTMRNVIARIPGNDPSGAVLITAHYDSRGLSVGAADDGVGVVAILEAVRAIQTGPAMRNDVIVLFTDGEEIGLLGAHAFVDEHPALEDVSIVLSFEMRGSAGPSLMFETNEENGWVTRQLNEFDEHPATNSVFTEIYRRMPNNTDFTVFREAGKQGLNFAAIDNAHVYHQGYDTPQNVSGRTLQHHGEHALSALRHFGEVDLTAVNAPNTVYFTIPGLGMVLYEQVWIWVLTGALFLILGASVLAARRAGATMGRIGAGLGVSVVTLALSFAAAHFLLEWLARFHPEAGSLHGSLYHREGWYVVAMCAVALVSVTGINAIAHRWLSTLELALGAVIIPLLGAVALTVLAPLGAMNLQWPVLATLAAITLLALLGDRANGYVGWIAVLLLAAPVLFLIVPLGENVWLGMQLASGGLVVVPFALAIVLIVPALEGLRHPNPWWAPVTGAVVAAAAVGLGVLNSRPNAERPAPSTLSYAYEHGTGSAVWVTDPHADSLDADAIEWAITTAGGSFDGTRDLSGFVYRAGQSPTATAPVVSAIPPEVVVARDEIDGVTRRVTLNVRSRIGAEYLAFVYDDRGDTRLLSINGHALEDPEALRSVEHWGVPDPYVVLELEMPADEAIGLHVVEHLLRPEELLGEDPFDRPPHLAPDIVRMSDRAMFRYSVGAFADPRHAILLPGAQPPQATGGTTPGEGTPATADTLVADTSSVDSSGVEAPSGGDSGQETPATEAPGTETPQEPATGEPAVVQPAADTAAAETAVADTTAADTAVVDTLPSDTLASDTLPTDTLGAPTDTLAVPTDPPPLPTDTVRVGPVR